jgi:ketosteroid isomerase-like protein
MSEPPASIPRLIEIYQAAHDRHDVGAALATFTEDAVVRDEDETWTGTDQIRQWLAKTSSEYTYTRTLLGFEPTGTTAWLVRNRLEGNFPGNMVDLRYEFTLDGDRISELTIAP